MRRGMENPIPVRFLSDDHWFSPALTFTLDLDSNEIFDLEIGSLGQAVQEGGISESGSFSTKVLLKFYVPTSLFP